MKYNPNMHVLCKLGLRPKFGLRTKSDLFYQVTMQCSSVDAKWLLLKNKLPEGTEKFVPKISNFYEWHKPSWKCPLPTIYKSPSSTDENDKAVNDLITDLSSRHMKYILLNFSCYLDDDETSRAVPVNTVTSCRRQADVMYIGNASSSSS